MKPIEKIKQIAEKTTQSKFKYIADNIIANTANPWNPHQTWEEAQEQDRRRSIQKITIKGNLVEIITPVIAKFDEQIPNWTKLIYEEGLQPENLLNPEYRKKWRNKIPQAVADIEALIKATEKTHRKYGVKPEIKGLDTATPHLACITDIQTAEKAIQALHHTWQQLRKWLNSKQREQLYGYNIVPWRTKTTWKKWQDIKA